ncbi:MAG: carboxypeptidase regulatory-like domain-containing protein [Flavobacteriia bacterium]|nr:carboxypeptidase regulatory-like domain-containing protein [Flavobacteriia bacterium]
MNSFSLIALLLLSTSTLAQKWHLERVDTNQDYPFEYWFWFQNEDDTSSYNLTRDISQFSSISVIDNNGDSIPLVQCTILNLYDESEIRLITDWDGHAVFDIPIGTYRMELAHQRYDDYSFVFEIKSGEQLNLQIKLGLGPELDGYQIDATHILSEEEILEIIGCVRRNRSDFYEQCSQGKKVKIYMLI